MKFAADHTFKRIRERAKSLSDEDGQLRAGRDLGVRYLRLFRVRILHPASPSVGPLHGRPSTVAGVADA
jgi:hypothetical protein